MHRDQAGSGGLSYTNVGVAYSYTIRFNRHLAMRPALGMGYSQRGIDPSKLTFGDQLLTGDDRGIQASLVTENVAYMDVNAGALLFGDNLFVGYGAFHLNRPNESLMQKEELSSVRHTLHGGFRYVVNKNKKGEIKTAFNFAAQYKSQRDWDQLDIGGYFLYDPLMAGIWYRGLPGVKRYNDNPNNEAIILMLGVRTGEWRFAYSYDITLSQLWGNTGGAHELSLVYEKPRKKKRRWRFRTVPCPTF